MEECARCAPKGHLAHKPQLIYSKLRAKITVAPNRRSIRPKNRHCSRCPVDCLPSAAAVRQKYPNARPSWTLQAQGHEGSKCWYAATWPPSDDHQEGTAIMKPVAEPSQPAPSADTSDFHARLLSEAVPRELVRYRMTKKAMNPQTRVMGVIWFAGPVTGPICWTSARPSTVAATKNEIADSRKIATRQAPTTQPGRLAESGWWMRVAAKIKRPMTTNRTTMRVMEPVRVRGLQGTI